MAPTQQQPTSESSETTSSQPTETDPGKSTGTGQSTETHTSQPTEPDSGQSAETGQPTETNPVQPTNTDPSNGAINAYAAAHTWLGTPTGEITAIAARSEGAMRTYQHGTVYWSANTKVHAVASNTDSCYQKHLQVLGFPTTDEIKLNGGASQAFQYGQIHWSPRTGARFTTGAIQQYWSAHGWQNGWLGWPTGDELTVKGGASQTFQHGTLFWSNSTGAHAIKGGILGEYAHIAYEQSKLGFPTTDEIKLNGGASQAFQYGQIHWSPRTGARFTTGAIQQYWSAHGWQNGWLGWPTGDELTVKGGASQTFQHGTVFWSNSTGTHAVVGTTLSKYAAARYEQGKYGFPIEDQTGPSQKFQHGSIAGCGKNGYQNPTGFFQMSSCNVSVPSGVFGYASPSKISINANRDQVVNAFISRAYDYLGTRYVWDYAMQPGNGVDCAGLVMQSLYATGMNLQDYNPSAHWYDPWHSHDANNMSGDSRFKHIPLSQRQRGDLIFYPGHVAIYLGNDQVIEAVPPRVRVANMYAGNRHPTGAARPFI
ncbi:NlpC/P60 family protein [Bifidobacterium apri]|uniref:NlpC/P60 family protein n=1 Tax=Bifidobacterium apri TaxID=1769423 RepID=UPI003992DE40